MNKILNKIVCLFGFLVSVQEISEANSTQFLLKSNAREKDTPQSSIASISKPDKQEEILEYQKKDLKKQMETIGSYLYITLDSYFSSIFNSYNYFMEHLSECCKFPMFFQINEAEFPRGLIYLKPDERSIQVLDNLMKIQSFFMRFRNSILNIYEKLDNIFAANFFQLRSMTYDDSQNTSGQLETIPEETFPIIKLFEITPISSIDKIEYSHGLCEFKEFTKNIASNPRFLFEISQIRKLFIKFSESLNSTSQSIRGILFFLNKFDNLKKESELVGLLFTSIYEISREFSNNLLVLNKIDKLSSDLTTIYERLSLRNLMRSNFMEELFGSSVRRTSALIPDITPVLFYIKSEFRLSNNSQAMEFFSYIANLQLLNHPIGDHYNNINTKELIKIYNNILFLKK